jgi:hypothetical protein
MEAAGAPMSAMDMQSVIDLGDSMSQEGSGTSWVPRSTQMFGWMRMGPRDIQMTHGEIFPRYVSTGSLRGDRRLDAPNWFMFMGTHSLSASTQFGYTAFPRLINNSRSFYHVFELAADRISFAEALDERHLAGFAFHVCLWNRALACLRDQYSCSTHYRVESD